MLTLKVTAIPRSAEGGAIGQAVGGVVEATPACQRQQL
jgi:hypothetical protein